MLDGTDASAAGAAALDENSAMLAVLFGFNSADRVLLAQPPAITAAQQANKAMGNRRAEIALLMERLHAYLIGLRD